MEKVSESMINLTLRWMDYKNRRPYQFPILSAKNKGLRLSASGSAGIWGAEDCPVWICAHNSLEFLFLADRSRITTTSSWLYKMSMELLYPSWQLEHIWPFLSDLQEGCVINPPNYYASICRSEFFIRKFNKGTLNKCMISILTEIKFDYDSHWSPITPNNKVFFHQQNFFFAPFNKKFRVNPQEISNLINI